MIDPMFLTTRETFPGEKSFGELARAFFVSGPVELRAAAIERAWSGEGSLLVHMANPEQLDDLFAHVARETKVRFLSTSYLHADFRSTVYAIGRGTGLLIDGNAVDVTHVSVEDSASETDGRGELVASDHARVASLRDLHAALAAGPRDHWNEVNVSFEGPSPILGFFALDGVLSKLYGTALVIKSGGLLPLYTYNRHLNRLARFVPTPEAVAALAEAVPAPHLRERYRSLARALEKENDPVR